MHQEGLPLTTGTGREEVTGAADDVGEIVGAAELFGGGEAWETHDSSWISSDLANASNHLSLSPAQHPSGYW